MFIDWLHWLFVMPFTFVKQCLSNFKTTLFIEPAFMPVSVPNCSVILWCNTHCKMADSESLSDGKRNKSPESSAEFILNWKTLLPSVDSVTDIPNSKYNPKVEQKWRTTAIIQDTRKLPKVIISVWCIVVYSVQLLLHMITQTAVLDNNFLYNVMGLGNNKKKSSCFCVCAYQWSSRRCFYLIFWYNITVSVASE